MTHIAGSPTRGGLTLVEVLAASVLLSLLSVVAVSLLRDVARLSESEAPVSVAEFSLLADRVLTRPESFGIESGSEGDFRPPPGFRAVVEWPDHPEREPVILSRLDHRAGEGFPPAGYAWLVFSHDRIAVVRFIPIRADEGRSP